MAELSEKRNPPFSKKWVGKIITYEILAEVYEPSFSSTIVPAVKTHFRNDDKCPSNGDQKRTRMKHSLGMRGRAFMHDRCFSRLL